LKYGDNESLLKNINNSLEKVASAQANQTKSAAENSVNNSLRSMKSVDKTGMISRASDQPAQVENKSKTHHTPTVNTSKVIKPSQFSQPMFKIKPHPQIPTQVSIEPTQPFKYVPGMHPDPIEQFSKLFSGIVQIKVEPKIRIVSGNPKHSRAAPVKARRIEGTHETQFSKYQQEDQSRSDSYSDFSRSDHRKTHSHYSNHGRHGHTAEKRFRVKTSKRRRSETESEEDEDDNNPSMTESVKIKVVKRRHDNDKAVRERRRSSLHKDSLSASVSHKGKGEGGRRTHGHNESTDKHSQPVPTLSKKPQKDGKGVPQTTASETDNNVPKVKQRLANIANSSNTPAGVAAKKEDSLLLDTEDQAKKSSPQGKGFQSSLEMQVSGIEKRDSDKFVRGDINGKASPEGDKKSINAITSSPENQMISATNGPNNVTKTPAFNIRTNINEMPASAPINKTVPRTEAVPDKKPFQPVQSKLVTSELTDQRQEAGQPQKQSYESKILDSSKNLLKDLLGENEDPILRLPHHREIYEETLKTKEELIREKLLILLKENFEEQIDNLQIVSPGIPSQEAPENLEFCVKVSE
jgi:hypothetical protein